MKTLKITKNLPQFDKERALIVISGRQASDIYLAFNGEISLLDSPVYETPKYSDREGFAMRAGRGQNLSSGWVYEEDKHDIVFHFIKFLEKSLSKILVKNKISDIYLFLPKHYNQVILNKLSKKISSKIKKIYFGNYLKKTPFYVLGIIKKDQTETANKKKPILTKKEGLKIMKKSVKARKVIKGRS